MTVDILLATYNGEKYLREQLDTIQRQTDKDWRLLVRDDGSSDNTLKILHEYQKKIGPDKFILLESPTSEDRGVVKGRGTVRRRVINNFSALMERSLADGRAEYAMFADQDDHWHPNKIERSMTAMHCLEGEHGRNTPLMVFTDVTLINNRGGILDVSYRDAHKQYPSRTTLRKELVHTTTQGCTMMMNRELMDRALPIPDKAMMHDCWVALVALSSGHHEYLTEPTMKYRQHDANVTIARRPHESILVRKANILKRVLHEGMDCRLEQAQALLTHLGPNASPKAEEDLKLFLEIGAIRDPVSRGIRMMHEGFSRWNIPGNIELFGGKGIGGDEGVPAPSRR